MQNKKERDRRAVVNMEENVEDTERKLPAEINKDIEKLLVLP